MERPLTGGEQIITELRERGAQRPLVACLKVKQRIVDIHQQNAHWHKRILRESFFVL